MRSYKHNISKQHELQFAAITSPLKEKITHAMNKLFTVTSQRGLTISAPKPKLAVGGSIEHQQELQFDEMQIESVEESKYLGSIIARNGSIKGDVKERICQGILCLWQFEEVCL